MPEAGETPAQEVKRRGLKPEDASGEKKAFSARDKWLIEQAAALKGESVDEFLAKHPLRLEELHQAVGVDDGPEDPKYRDNRGNMGIGDWVAKEQREEDKPEAPVAKPDNKK